MSADTTTHTDSDHSHGRCAPNPEAARGGSTGTRRPAARAGVGPAERVRLRETERAILRARVVTLERALARRERRLQTVIEQYETILDERGDVPTGAMSTGCDATDDNAESDSGGVVGRVRAALSGLF